MSCFTYKSSGSIEFFKEQNNAGKKVIETKQGFWLVMTNG